MSQLSKRAGPSSITGFGDTYFRRSHDLVKLDSNSGSDCMHKRRPSVTYGIYETNVGRRIFGKSTRGCIYKSHKDSSAHLFEKILESVSLRQGPWTERFAQASLNQRKGHGTFVRGYMVARV